MGQSPVSAGDRPSAGRQSAPDLSGPPAKAGGPLCSLMVQEGARWPSPGGQRCCF